MGSINNADLQAKKEGQDGKVFTDRYREYTESVDAETIHVST